MMDHGDITLAGIMLPCCLPSDPNSLQLSVFVIFASLSERYLSATSSLCVAFLAFLGSSASWLTFHTRSDTNTADSNHADNKSKPELYKNDYPLKRALLDLEMKRYKIIFSIQYKFSVFDADLSHVREQLSQIICLHTYTHTYGSVYRALAGETK